MRKQCLEFALPNPGEICKHLAGAYNSNSNTRRLLLSYFYWNLRAWWNASIHRKAGELEKQAACLLFRLGEICNSRLLPGPADEHVLFLVDVMNLPCSLQVKRKPLPSCFYGRTLPRTVPAVCTGPPCQEMVQIQVATKSPSFAWNSTDFCQITIISNSSCKCPITEPKKLG